MSQMEDFFELIAKGDVNAVRERLSTEPALAEGKNEAGSTALQWAAYNGKSDITEALLSAGPSIDLWTACSIGSLKDVKPLSEKDDLSPDGFTPLGLAAAFGHNDIVKFLLENGADPNRPSKALGGVPPLQSAVFGRNMEGLTLLMDAGANVNATQNGDFTALMGAAQNGDLAMVKVLLERGANPKFANSQKKTAYDLATSDEIRELLTK